MYVESGQLYDDHGDRIVNTADAAKIIGVTTGRVRQIARAERLPGFRISGSKDWFFSPYDCVRYAKSTEGIGRPRTGG